MLKVGRAESGYCLRLEGPGTVRATSSSATATWPTWAARAMKPFVGSPTRSSGKWRRGVRAS